MYATSIMNMCMDEPATICNSMTAGAYSNCNA